MPTRSVRLRAEDIALVNDITDLDGGAPFSMKLHVLLRELMGKRDDVEAIRLALRQELDRFTGEA